MKNTRSKYKLVCRNVVHGSDSPENGKREIGKGLTALSLTEAKQNDEKSRFLSL